MSAMATAYLALACEDVARVAGVFQDTLALPRHDLALAGGPEAPVFPAGEAALALFETDDPRLDGPAVPGVRHLAFTSRAPARDAEALGLAGAAVDGEFRVDPATTGGLQLRLAPALEGLDRTPGPVVQRIDHVGVACADNRAAQALFVARMSCPLESTQTDMEVSMAVESFTSDSYGVVYHNRPPVPVGGLRVSFVTVGDFELEFLQPFDPTPEAGDSGEPLGAGPGTTRGDRGAIGRYIARRGPGLHHLALKTPDIAAALTRFARAGLWVIDRAGRPGSRRALIGFVHPSALGGVLLHFVQRTPLPGR